MTGSNLLGGSWVKAVAFVALLMAGGVVGCGEDCSDEAAAARQFLETPANLSCASSDDCVVVGTGCEEFPKSFCGQVQLNRQAAESSRWRELSNDLSSCHSDTCAQCLARLLPQCIDGFCGGPP